MVTTLPYDRHYFAIIGDIVGSKKLQDRKKIQEDLSKVLHDINTTYENVLSSKLMITLGDEFQGLLQNGTFVTEIVERIEREMYPIKIRFGIGVGKITTNIDLNSPFGIDGPAYYNAREMIDSLKKNEKKRMDPKSNIKIKIEDNECITELINSIFLLNAIIKSRWTKRQREIVSSYIEYKETQSSVAEKLGINQSNVQKALRSTGYYSYNQALHSIEKALLQIQEKQYA